MEYWGYHAIPATTHGLKLSATIRALVNLASSFFLEHKSVLCVLGFEKCPLTIRPETLIDCYARMLKYLKWTQL